MNIRCVPAAQTTQELGLVLSQITAAPAQFRRVEIPTIIQSGLMMFGQTHEVVLPAMNVDWAKKIEPDLSMPFSMINSFSAKTMRSPAAIASQTTSRKRQVIVLNRGALIAYWWQPGALQGEYFMLTYEPLLELTDQSDSILRQLYQFVTSYADPGQARDALCEHMQRKGQPQKQISQST